MFRAATLVAALTIAHLSLAQSQPPSPTPTKASQAQENKAGSTNQPTDADKRDAKLPPIVINVVPPAETEEEKREKREDRDQRTSLERWNAGSTIVIAIFTAILAGSTILLWLDTRKSSSAAMRAANVAEKTLAITQRAYVSVHGYKTTPIFRNKQITGWEVSIIWENTGGTLASDFMAGSEICDVALNQTITSPMQITHADAPAKAILGSRSTLHTPEVISVERADRMKDGDRRFLLVGRAEYRDVFQQSHYTLVCVELRLLDPSANLATVAQPFSYHSFGDHNQAT